MAEDCWAAVLLAEEETKPRVLETLRAAESSCLGCLSLLSTERLLCSCHSSVSRGFGTVYKAFDAATGQAVAIKKLDLQQQGCEEMVKEILVMREMKNPNIVTYLESYLANEAVWLVLEYMDGGSLAMVILMKTMAVGHIATVCQEVRNPSACAWHALERLDL
ncbi:serine/threonine-protein kinase PAK 1-like [Cyanistes caeruleus]|uniref:serine/threonine-protein kinase PAK 1-like n=1 Tax=Cyanistes caeruleus TaxID=156563 RepID=UPI000CDA6EF5|nr:serine/threonine-protein kinase PAK 1-like [Cyanistes caeruleus]